MAPDAPVINRFLHDELGRVREIRGTSEPDATVHVYEGLTELGSANAGDGDWTYTPPTPLPAGPHLIAAIAEDISSNTSPRSSYHGMNATASINALPDGGVTHSGSGSLRLEKTGSCEFKFTVNDGVPVTSNVWMTKNSSYAGTAPKITLTGLGIDGSGSATASLSATLPDWAQLSVSGTPAAKGVVTLRVETFSTADGAKAWIDDISVSQ